MRANAQHPRCVADAAAVQGQVRNFSPHPRLMDFLAVLELEGAAAGGTAITLSAIGGFAVSINGFRLLADRAENGELNHRQIYVTLHTQHTTN